MWYGFLVSLPLAVSAFVGLHVSGKYYRDFNTYCPINGVDFVVLLFLFLARSKAWNPWNLSNPWNRLNLAKLKKEAAKLLQNSESARIVLFELQQESW